MTLEEEAVQLVILLSGATNFSHDSTTRSVTWKFADDREAQLMVDATLAIYKKWREREAAQ